MEGVSATPSWASTLVEGSSAPPMCGGREPAAAFCGGGVTLLGEKVVRPPRRDIRGSAAWSGGGGVPERLPPARGGVLSYAPASEEKTGQGRGRGPRPRVMSTLTWSAGSCLKPWPVPWVTVVSLEARSCGHRGRALPITGVGTRVVPVVRELPPPFQARGGMTSARVTRRPWRAGWGGVTLPGARRAYVILPVFHSG